MKNKQGKQIREQKVEKKRKKCTPWFGRPVPQWQPLRIFCPQVGLVDGLTNSKSVFKKRHISYFRLKQRSKRRDLRKWASLESSLAERRIQGAGKEEKTFCSFPSFLDVRCSTPLVSVANWLLRWACDTRRKNSSCKTQKSATPATIGERHSSKTKLCVTPTIWLDLRNFAYFTVYFITAFLANISGPVKAWISWIWIFGRWFIDFPLFNNCG